LAEKLFTAAKINTKGLKMEWLLRFWSRTDVFICGAGIIGDILLVVGIVTAVLNTSIAGFTPVVWILLAFVLYITMIFSAVLRIMRRLETGNN
jgi:hypothetical protein